MPQTDGADLIDRMTTREIARTGGPRSRTCRRHMDAVNVWSKVGGSTRAWDQQGRKVARSECKAHRSLSNPLATAEESHGGRTGYTGAPGRILPCLPLLDFHKRVAPR